MAYRHPLGSVRYLARVPVFSPLHSTKKIHNMRGLSDVFNILPMNAFPSRPLLIALVTAAVLPLSTNAAESPTFTEHIAPIVFANCTGCHRPGEAAPFALTNFREVQKRGKLIAQVTEEGDMPPWSVRAGDVPFKETRELSTAQTDLIRAWVDAGMPEGPADKLPDLPKFTEGWQLGTPDLVVKMDAAYTVPADGPDIYRNFVIPLDLTSDKWVRAIEFRPGTSAVHHSLFYKDTTGAAREADAEDAEPGFKKMGLNFRGGAGGGDGTSRGGGSLGGWAVGGAARFLPEGLAYHLPKGADLVLSTHFHPSGKKEQEASTIGLYFTDTPPTHSFAGVQLPPAFGALAGIDIPAGDANYKKIDRFTLPTPVKAFGVSAHAHYLGRSMLMTAQLPGPDGKKLTLLDIPDWDFNWQEQYDFEDFLELPAGTVIESTVHWDNSAKNPNNPNDPPRRVRWGRESEDEMGSITLLVASKDKQAMQELRRELGRHSGKSIAGRFGEFGLQLGEGDARANLIKRFDKNGDGKIDREEFQALRKEARNRPGVLNRIRGQRR